MRAMVPFAQSALFAPFAPFAPFALLLERDPVVFAHLMLALGALVLGVFILLRRKGDGGHRALGWAWVLLMGGAALSSVFIGDERLPSLAGITPIHLLTLYVLWLLPHGVIAARRGQVQAHRRSMRGLYIGGCVVAGLFTLLPGRFLGDTLWRHTLGLLP
jgi:uncharacterized membrane protein